MDKLIITVFTEINHIPLLRRVLTAASLGCKVPKNKELRMTKCVTLFGVYYKFNIKEVAKSMFSYFTDHIKAKIVMPHYGSQSNVTRNPIHGMRGSSKTSCDGLANKNLIS